MKNIVNDLGKSRIKYGDCIKITPSEFSSICKKTMGPHPASYYCLWVGKKLNPGEDKSSLVNYIDEPYVFDQLAKYFDVEKVLAISCLNAEQPFFFIRRQGDRYDYSYASEITNDTLPQFLGQVVDDIEDLFERRGTWIPSVDRDIEIEEFIKQNPDMRNASYEDICQEAGFARIYGEAYDALTSEIEAAIHNLIDAGKPTLFAFTNDVMCDLIEKTIKNFIEYSMDADNLASKDMPREQDPIPYTKITEDDKNTIKFLIFKNFAENNLISAVKDIDWQ